MGNSATGNYETTPERTMAAFDKLPVMARAALRDAVENWVPQPLVTKWNRGQASGEMLVADVKRWDRLELAKRESQRINATGPYKGNAPDRAAQQQRRKPAKVRRRPHRAGQGDG